MLTIKLCKAEYYRLEEQFKCMPNGFHEKIWWNDRGLLANL